MRMVKRKESIPVNMLFLAFVPAQSAEISTDELPGTIEERNPQYGDAAREWRMVHPLVMHQPCRNQNFKMQSSRQSISYLAAQTE